MVESLLIVSFFLLVRGCFFWLREDSSRISTLWRKMVGWFGLIALVLALLMFARFLTVVWRMEAAHESFVGENSPLTSMVRWGSLFADVAVVGSCFTRGRSRIFFLSASVIIWILWIAQAMGL
jgi:hypothetical protein